MLHGAALLLLVFFVLFDFFKPKEDVHVFEMVAVDASSKALPSVVKPPPSKQQPPEKKAPSQPTAPPKLIKYSDFIKENPLPKPKAKSRQSTAQNQTAVPLISIPKIILNNTAPGNQLSANQVNALSNYNARLRARIDAAWRKPTSLGGMALSLKVIFEVSASGQITRIQFSPDSGNASFDATVLAAFRAVGNAGATPTGQKHRFSMEFRLD